MFYKGVVKNLKFEMLLTREEYKKSSKCFFCNYK